MKILMISRGVPSKFHPHWGCFEKDQAEALAAYGHKIIVISVDTRLRFHRGRLGLHHIVDNGVEYYNYVTFPGFFIIKTIGYNFFQKKYCFYYYDKLYRKIITEHGVPDVIYTHFCFMTFYGAMLKQKYKFNVPLVGIEHFSKFNAPVLPKDLETLATFAFQNVDKLICVCKSLADNIERRLGFKSIVVHNMYGHEFEKGINYNFNAVIKYPLIFISTARLVYGKGFDVLIKAFAKAQLPKTTWKLNIIGWGEEQKNLEQLIVSYGLQDNIFLLGKKDKVDIVNELSEGHVFVLPSRGENFSVAILEALAMGLPVISTDCGGIRQCLDDRNGIIVPIDDVDAMSDAIHRMMDTYSQYDRNYIAENCRKQFSPMAIAEKLTAVFEDTIEKTRI